MNNPIRALGGWLRRSFGVGQLRQLIYGPPTIAGVAISEEIALGLSAVYRAVVLISSTVASLDGEVVAEDESGGHRKLRRHWVSRLLADPNDDQNHFKFWRTFVMHAVAAGNGYAEIERDDLGRPIALHIVHWRDIRPRRDPDGSLSYELVRLDRTIPAADVLHLTAISWDGILGISPIRAARETLGISVAAERFSGSVFGNSGVPRGFLKLKGVPNPETKANIRDAWEFIHGGPASANKVGILGGDTDWVETNMSPEDAQLLTSRAFQVEEVARIFGVPVNLLFSGTQSSYNSNEESNIQFYQLGLRTLLENLEAEIDLKLLTREERGRGLSVEFGVESILRGNFKATVDAWTRLFLTGLATQNEGRRAVGLNPMDGGDALYVPANMQISTDDKGVETVKASLAATPAGPAASGATTHA